MCNHPGRVCLVGGLVLFLEGTKRVSILGFCIVPRVAVTLDLTVKSVLT